MLNEIIKKNRSFRRFKEREKIDFNLLKSFIENARYCPTARNQQVLMFKPENDPKVNEKIFPQLKWAGYLKDWDRPVKGERPSAYIIIGINKNRLIKKDDEWANSDLGIAAQTIMLQAAEKNLGGCIIAAFNNAKIKKILQIPDFIEPKLILALGKPAETVKIVESNNEDDIKYYRKNNIHFVPKRKLKDIIF